METKIESCICEHKYQDERYGKGKRVKNISGKPKEQRKPKCTVCGRFNG